MSEELIGPSPETTIGYWGQLVRFAAIDPEADAETFVRWFDDPMSTRLAGWRPNRPINSASAREHLEEWVKAAPGSMHFAVRTIADDRLVGGIGLKDINLVDETTELDLDLYRQEDWSR